MCTRSIIMTHQTVLQEDPDSPLAPESPALLFDASVNSPKAIPPTPPRLNGRRSRLTRNLLENFADLDEMQDPRSPGSPIWQSSQRERRSSETSDRGSNSRYADTSSLTSGFDSAGASPFSAGNDSSKAVCMFT